MIYNFTITIFFGLTNNVISLTIVDEIFTIDYHLRELLFM